jgi:hypothetical protein
LLALAGVLKTLHLGLASKTKGPLENNRIFHSNKNIFHRKSYPSPTPIIYFMPNTIFTVQIISTKSAFPFVID